MLDMPNDGKLDEIERRATLEMTRIGGQFLMIGDMQHQPSRPDMQARQEEMNKMKAQQRLEF